MIFNCLQWGFFVLVFLHWQICMSHLVHVGLDAAHKERVGGAECGHQGMQRVLEHRHNTDELQEYSEENSYWVTLNSRSGRNTRNAL